MNVAAAPHRHAPGAALADPRPLRNPDTSSREVMTRRGWWLVVMNFVLPGSAQLLAGNRRLGRIGIVATIAAWAAVALLVALALWWRPVFVGLVANWWMLLLVQAVLLAYAVLWVALTVDTLRLVRLVRARPRARVAIAALAVVLVAVPASAAVYAAQSVVAPARAGLSVFGSGPAVAPSDGYYNFLLIGADSAQGRDHMLFDSISVVSVNADTGAVTIFGIPRDLRDVPFSDGPMQQLYPDGHTGHADPECGWDDKINQLNTEVGLCRADEQLYPDAVARGSTPGIEATRDAAEGVLGLEIPYFVFIDMDGFAALIDALGGVDITVTERLPTGALHENPDGSLSGITGWIEVGDQHMDGETALWYARSRYTTSDWDRMTRQRELQTAILAQFTPTNVLTRFQDIMSAGTDVVQTDIPSEMLPDLTELAVKAREQDVTTIELTADSGIDPDQPDYPAIHDLVERTLHPEPAPE
ncbi:LCP family protein [Microbacterium sp.]|uniref:LCP family protein n=1 Tax=Microbacterium sp. TaxID=51671 RepID=UPI003A862C2A